MAYMWRPGHLWELALTFYHVGPRDWTQVSDLVATAFTHWVTSLARPYILKQGLSLNLELNDWAGLSGQQAPGSPCLLPPAPAYGNVLLHPDFYVYAADPSLGPHVCPASTFLTEVTPSLSATSYRCGPAASELETSICTYCHGCVANAHWVSKETQQLHTVEETDNPVGWDDINGLAPHYKD